MKNSIEASDQLKRKQGEHPLCSSPRPRTGQAIDRLAVQVETMWILKKIFVFTMVLFLVALFSVDSMAEKRIGILMFSEETRYDEASKGIMDKLTEEGFGEPQTGFIRGNADANKAKAAELVQEFAASKLDLIFTLGTSMSVPVSREIKDVPIVFSIVYDPVEAGIAKDWKSSGNNTTGISTKLPMSSILDCLKAFAPVKRLAVLYSPGEKNSEAQLKDLQGVQSSYEIKVVPVPLTKKEEITQILPQVIRTVDALFVTGSNLVDIQIAMIVDMATRAKVITITHLKDLVEKGVLLGVCTSPYLGGRLAGEKAVEILRGAKPASIPIETLKDYDWVINMKTSKAGQFQIPPEFMKKVREKIE